MCVFVEKNVSFELICSLLLWALRAVAVTARGLLAICLHLTETLTFIHISANINLTLRGNKAISPVGMCSYVRHTQLHERMCERHCVCVCVWVCKGPCVSHTSPSN